MDNMMSQVKSIAKHGQDIKSVKIKDGDKKVKVKFRERAMEKAKKAHSVPH